MIQCGTPLTMPFNIWLIRKREEAGLTQGQLGKKVGGKTKQAVSVWEKGVNASGNPIKYDPQTVKDIVRALRSAGLEVTEYEAFREAGIPIPEAPSPDNTQDAPADPLLLSLQGMSRILRDDLPNLGLVPAGDPERRHEEYLGNLARAFEADYIVQVTGDSMEPHYHDGDILVVRRITQPDPGDNVIALVYGDSVCKKFTAWQFDETTGETIYTLAPTNHKYREIKASDVQFQGVIVGRFIPEKRARPET